MSQLLAAPPVAEESSLSAASIRARIGNVGAGAQVAIGDHIIQVQAAAGAVVNVTQPVPPPRRRPAPVFERPRPVEDLLDRTQEMAAVRAALAAASPLEFHGEAGLGKSTLLRSLAYLADGHPDGVVHGSARRLELSDLLQLLFDAFFEFAENVKLTDAEIRRHLQDVRALVLLDDVTLDRDDVDALLDAAPGCIFVLAAEGRVLWGQGQALVLSGLDENTAVELFARELGRAVSGSDLGRVQRYCRMVGGNPLRILQAAAEARDGRRSLASVLDAGGAPTLSGNERRVLAAVAALGGAAMGAEHAAAISGVPDAAAVLAGLERRGVVSAAGSGFVPALRPPEADPGMATAAVAYFAQWTPPRQDTPAQLIGDADALRAALEVAAANGRWREADQIARGLQAALALFGLWSAWRAVLELGMKAARGLGDLVGQAFYLHQLGTRSLGLGELDAARTLLEQAARLQQQAGNQAGAAASHANLQRIPRLSRAARLPVRMLTSTAGMGVVAGGLVVTVLAVTGVIVAPAPTWPAFASDQLAFGSVAVGSAAPQDLIVRNGSSAIARLGQITTAGDFWTTKGCPDPPAVLAPGGTCRVTIAFRPMGTGPRTGSVTLTGPAGIQHTALLSGTGTAPTLSFDREAMDFGSLAVGAKQSQPLTIRNAGSGQVAIKTQRAPTDFAVAGSCPLLDAGQACTLTVGFLPTATGSRTGWLEVVDGAGTIHSVALSGTGIQGVLSVDTDRIDFGPVSLRVPVQPRTVRISNSGTAPLTLGVINAVGDFAAAARCPSTLNPTDACVVSVALSPVTPGPVTGALVIPYDSTRFGIVPLGALVQAGNLVAPTSVDIAKTPTFVLTNKGPGAVLVSAPRLLVGTALVATSDCPQTPLAAGGSCTVKVVLPGIYALCVAFSDVVEIPNTTLVDPLPVLVRFSCQG